MSKTDWLLLSVQPRFAEKIFGGHKTAELRRLRPRLASEGRRVLFYTSSPVMALSGGATIERIVEGSRDELWRRIGALSGLSQPQFSSYFHGARRHVALVLCDVWRCENPTHLRVLRNRLPHFFPPQSYRYLSSEGVLDLLGAESAKELSELVLASRIPKPNIACGE